ncbi:uncharacterized protein LOC129269845 [Lytechinus pictus]|uniref:uncharacterized protein LOC129269845 n=1 Tax=Lytechinus pictus TaxID=7653 RepID=UPI0030BA15FF
MADYQRADENVSLDMLDAGSPQTDRNQNDTSLTDRIVKTFKDEITASTKNNASQLFMTITSGMFVVMTTPEDGAVYYLSVILSSLVFINVIVLLILILVRKRRFKPREGQCSVETMRKARKLQKVYHWLSISLVVFQTLFMIVTGVSVSRVTQEGDGHNITTTVAMATTSTVSEYAVNNTLTP